VVRPNFLGSGPPPPDLPVVAPLPRTVSALCLQTRISPGIILEMPNRKWGRLVLAFAAVLDMNGFLTKHFSSCSRRLCNDMAKCKELNKSCKKSARQDKQCWADDKLTSSEESLKRGATRDAFVDFRQLRSACLMISSPVLGAQRNLVSDEKNKMECWNDYYDQLQMSSHNSPMLLWSIQTLIAPEQQKMRWRKPLDV